MLLDTLDIYFPLWLNLAMPGTLLTMFAVNLGINSAVVLLAWGSVAPGSNSATALRYALFATLLGLMADFTALWGYEAVAGPVGRSGSVFAPAIIVPASILIFGLNFALARAFSLGRASSLRLAGLLAILTAPWTILVL